MGGLNSGPGPGITLLIAIVLVLAHTASSAPLYEEDEGQDTNSQALVESHGCYYNFQHYNEGERILTNEPCLNCTCRNRMLMCYLRVCPFTKGIGQNCTVEKVPGQCCPIITCPEVPVQLLTSTTTEGNRAPGAHHETKNTAVGHVDTNGCNIDGVFYPNGALVPASPEKPCELCYCIRNKTACIMQECALHVDGCRPVYEDGQCFPVRYQCDDAPFDEPPTTTIRPAPTPGLVFTTTTSEPLDCIHNNDHYEDGSRIITEDPCEHCYCLKGKIACAVQECGAPLEKEGQNCTALPAAPGKCCPDSYQCDVTMTSQGLSQDSYGTTEAGAPSAVDAVHPTHGYDVHGAMGMTHPFELSSETTTPSKEAVEGSPTPTHHVQPQELDKGTHTQSHVQGFPPTKPSLSTDDQKITSPEDPETSAHATTNFPINHTSTKNRPHPDSESHISQNQTPQPPTSNDDFLLDKLHNIIQDVQAQVSDGKTTQMPDQVDYQTTTPVQTGHFTEKPDILSHFPHFGSQHTTTQRPPGEPTVAPDHKPPEESNDIINKLQGIIHGIYSHVTESIMSTNRPQSTAAGDGTSPEDLATQGTSAVPPSPVTEKGSAVDRPEGAHGAEDREPTSGHRPEDQEGTSQPIGQHLEASSGEQNAKGTEAEVQETDGKRPTEQYTAVRPGQKLPEGSRPAGERPGDLEPGRYPGSVEGHTDGTRPTGNYPEAVTQAGQHPEGFMPGQKYPEGVESTEEYSSPTKVTPTEESDHTLRPGEAYPHKKKPGQEYPEGVTSNEKYPDDTKPSGQYPEGDEPVESYTEEAPSGQHYPDRGRPTEEYPEGTTPSEHHPEDIVAGQKRPTGVTAEEEYPEGVAGQSHHGVRPGQKYPEEGRPTGQYPNRRKPGQKYPGGVRPGQYYPDSDSTEEYPEGVTTTGYHPYGGKPGEHDPESARPGQKYPSGVRPTEKYPEGLQTAGQYPDGEDHTGKYPGGVRPSGHYPDTVKPDGMGPTEGYSEGVTGTESYPDGIRPTEQYHDRVRPGDYSEGIKPTGQYPEGVKPTVKYPVEAKPGQSYPHGSKPEQMHPDGIVSEQNPLEARPTGQYSYDKTTEEYPEGTKPGYIPDAFTQGEKEPDRLTPIGEYPEGETGSENFPDKRKPGQVYPDGGRPSQGYPEGVTATGHYPEKFKPGQKNPDGASSTEEYSEGVALTENYYPEEFKPGQHYPEGNRPLLSKPHYPKQPPATSTDATIEYHSSSRLPYEPETSTTLSDTNHPYPSDVTHQYPPSTDNPHHSSHHHQGFFPPGQRPLAKPTHGLEDDLSVTKYPETTENEVGEDESSSRYPEEVPEKPDSRPQGPPKHPYKPHAGQESGVSGTEYPYTHESVSGHHPESGKRPIGESEEPEEDENLIEGKPSKEGESGTAGPDVDLYPGVSRRPTGSNRRPQKPESEVGEVNGHPQEGSDLGGNYADRPHGTEYPDESGPDRPHGSLSTEQAFVTNYPHKPSPPSAEDQLLETVIPSDKPVSEGDSTENPVGGNYDEDTKRPHVPYDGSTGDKHPQETGGNDEVQSSTGTKHPDGDTPQSSGDPTKDFRPTKRPNEATGYPDTTESSTRYPDKVNEEHYPGEARPTGHYPAELEAMSKYPEGVRPTGEYPEGTTEQYTDRVKPGQDHSESVRPTEDYNEGVTSSEDVPDRRKPDHKYPDGVRPGEKYPEGGRPSGHHPSEAKPGQKYPEKVNSDENTEGMSATETYPHGSSPSQHYPEDTVPGQKHPEEGRPTGQYPNRRKPGQKYPGGVRPGQYYPDSDSTEEYPEGVTTTGYHPYGGKPGEHDPESARPGQKYPSGVRPTEKYPEGLQTAGQYPDGEDHTGKYPGGVRPSGHYPDTVKPDGMGPTEGYSEGVTGTESYPDGIRPGQNFPEGMRPGQNSTNRPTEEYSEGVKPTGEYPSEVKPGQEYPEHMRPTEKYPEDVTSTGYHLYGFRPTGQYPERVRPGQKHPGNSGSTEIYPDGLRPTGHYSDRVRPTEESVKPSDDYLQTVKPEEHYFEGESPGQKVADGLRPTEEYLEGTRPTGQYPDAVRPTVGHSHAGTTTERFQDNTNSGQKHREGAKPGQTHPDEVILTEQYPGFGSTTEYPEGTNSEKNSGNFPSKVRPGQEHPDYTLSEGVTSTERYPDESHPSGLYPQVGKPGQIHPEDGRPGQRPSDRLRPTTEKYSEEFESTGQYPHGQATEDYPEGATGQYPHTVRPGQKYPDGVMPTEDYSEGVTGAEHYPDRRKPGEKYPEGVNPTEEYPDEGKPTQKYPLGVTPRPNYPDGAKPGHHYPDGVRPGQVYPDKVKPGQRYPGSVKPTEQYLGTPETTEGYPDAEKPGEEYPDNEKPAENYPTGVKPGDHQEGVRPGQKHPDGERPSEGYDEEGKPTEEYPGTVRPGQKRPQKPSEHYPHSRPTEQYPEEVRPTEQFPGKVKPAQKLPDNVSQTEEYPEEGTSTVHNLDGLKPGHHPENTLPDEEYSEGVKPGQEYPNYVKPEEEHIKQGGSTEEYPEGITSGQTSGVRPTSELGQETTHSVTGKPHYPPHSGDSYATNVSPYQGTTLPDEATTHPHGFYLTGQYPTRPQTSTPHLKEPYTTDYPTYYPEYSEEYHPTSHPESTYSTDDPHLLGKPHDSHSATDDFPAAHQKPTTPAPGATQHQQEGSPFGPIHLTPDTTSDAQYGGDPPHGSSTVKPHSPTAHPQAAHPTAEDGHSGTEYPDTTGTFDSEPGHTVHPDAEGHLSTTRPEVTPTRGPQGVYAPGVSHPQGIAETEASTIYFDAENPGSTEVGLTDRPGQHPMGGRPHVKHPQYGTPLGTEDATAEEGTESPVFSAAFTKFPQRPQTTESEEVEHGTEGPHGPVASSPEGNGTESSESIGTPKRPTKYPQKPLPEQGGDDKELTGRPGSTHNSRPDEGVTEKLNDKGPERPEPGSVHLEEDGVNGRPDDFGDKYQTSSPVSGMASEEHETDATGRPKPGLEEPVTENSETTNLADFVTKPDVGRVKPQSGSQPHIILESQRPFGIEHPHHSATNRPHSPTSAFSHDYSAQHSITTSEPDYVTEYHQEPYNTVKPGDEGHSEGPTGRPHGTSYLEASTRPHGVPHGTEKHTEIPDTATESYGTTEPSEKSKPSDPESVTGKPNEKHPQDVFEAAPGKPYGTDKRPEEETPSNMYLPTAEPGGHLPQGEEQTLETTSSSEGLGEGSVPEGPAHQGGDVGFTDRIPVTDEPGEEDLFTSLHHFAPNQDKPSSADLTHEPEPVSPSHHTTTKHPSQSTSLPDSHLPHTTKPTSPVSVDDYPDRPKPIATTHSSYHSESTTPPFGASHDPHHSTPIDGSTTIQQHTTTPGANKYPTSVQDTATHKHPQQSPTVRPEEHVTVGTFVGTSDTPEGFIGEPLGMTGHPVFGNGTEFPGTESGESVTTTSPGDDDLINKLHHIISGIKSQVTDGKTSKLPHEGSTTPFGLITKAPQSLYPVTDEFGRPVSNQPDGGEQPHVQTPEDTVDDHTETLHTGYPFVGGSKPQTMAVPEKGSTEIHSTHEYNRRHPTTTPATQNRPQSLASTEPETATHDKTTSRPQHPHFSPSSTNKYPFGESSTILRPNEGPISHTDLSENPHHAPPVTPASVDHDMATVTPASDDAQFQPYDNSTPAEGDAAATQKPPQTVTPQDLTQKHSSSSPTDKPIHLVYPTYYPDGVVTRKPVTTTHDQSNNKVTVTPHTTHHGGLQPLHSEQTTEYQQGTEITRVPSTSPVIIVEEVHTEVHSERATTKPGTESYVKQTTLSVTQNPADLHTQSLLSESTTRAPLFTVTPVGSVPVTKEPQHIMHLYSPKDKHPSKVTSQSTTASPAYPHQFFQTTDLPDTHFTTDAAPGTTYRPEVLGTRFPSRKTTQKPTDGAPMKQEGTTSPSMGADVFPVTRLPGVEISSEGLPEGTSEAPHTTPEEFFMGVSKKPTQGLSYVPYKVVDGTKVYHPEREQSQRPEGGSSEFDGYDLIPYEVVKGTKLFYPNRVVTEEPAQAPTKPRPMGMYVPYKIVNGTKVYYTKDMEQKPEDYDGMDYVPFDVVNGTKIFHPERVTTTPAPEGAMYVPFKIVNGTKMYYPMNAQDEPEKIPDEYDGFDYIPYEIVDGNRVFHPERIPGHVPATVEHSPAMYVPYKLVNGNKVYYPQEAQVEPESVPDEYDGFDLVPYDLVNGTKVFRPHHTTTPPPFPTSSSIPAMFVPYRIVNGTKVYFPNHATHRPINAPHNYDGFDYLPYNIINGTRVFGPTRTTPRPDNASTPAYYPNGMFVPYKIINNTKVFFPKDAQHHPRPLKPGYDGLQYLLYDVVNGSKVFRPETVTTSSPTTQSALYVPYKLINGTKVYYADKATEDKHRIPPGYHGYDYVPFEIINGNKVFYPDRVAPTTGMYVPYKNQNGTKVYHPNHATEKFRPVPTGYDGVDYIPYEVINGTRVFYPDRTIPTQPSTTAKPSTEGVTHPQGMFVPYKLINGTKVYFTQEAHKRPQPLSDEYAGLDYVPYDVVNGTLVFHPERVSPTNMPAMYVPFRIVNGTKVFHPAHATEDPHQVPAGFDGFDYVPYDLVNGTRVFHPERLPSYPGMYVPYKVVNGQKVFYPKDAKHRPEDVVEGYDGFDYLPYDTVNGTKVFRPVEVETEPASEKGMFVPYKLVNGTKVFYPKHGQDKPYLLAEGFDGFEYIPYKIVDGNKVFETEIIEPNRPGTGQKGAMYVPFKIINGTKVYYPKQAQPKPQLVAEGYDGFDYVPYEVMNGEKVFEPSKAVTFLPGGMPAMYVPYKLVNGKKVYSPTHAQAKPGKVPEGFEGFDYLPYEIVNGEKVFQPSKDNSPRFSYVPYKIVNGTKVFYPKHAQDTALQTPEGYDGLEYIPYVIINGEKVFLPELLPVLEPSFKKALYVPYKLSNGQKVYYPNHAQHTPQTIPPGYDGFDYLPYEEINGNKVFQPDRPATPPTSLRQAMYVPFRIVNGTKVYYPKQAKPNPQLLPSGYDGFDFLPYEIVNGTKVFDPRPHTIPTHLHAMYVPYKLANNTKVFYPKDAHNNPNYVPQGYHGTDYVPYEPLNNTKVFYPELISLTHPLNHPASSPAQGIYVPFKLVNNKKVFYPKEATPFPPTVRSPYDGVAFVPYKAVNRPSQIVYVDDDALRPSSPPPQAFPSPPHVPGEGSCYLSNKTYPNNTDVPPVSPCQARCMCLSSVVRCVRVQCPPPPDSTFECSPVYREGSCCPTYACGDADNDYPTAAYPETVSQSHSHGLPSTTSSPDSGMQKKPFDPNAATGGSGPSEEYHLHRPPKPKPQHESLEPYDGIEGQLSPDEDYDVEDEEPYGPGTCRYAGKVYVSAQQIPRDDPCDFCFCFRSDIICLQQSCPPPIPGCRDEPIQGFCCPRYECHVKTATIVNMTSTTTTTTTTLPPHFLRKPIKGWAPGCLVQGKAYRVGTPIPSASGPCMDCYCGGNGRMQCEPKVCTPEPIIRKMIGPAENATALLSES